MKKLSGLTTKHCAPLLLFLLALKQSIHEVLLACSLSFARRQVCAFSWDGYRNFYGSGLEGSVEDEEVDITVKVRSDFRFQVLVLVLKVMDGRFNFL